VQLSFSREVENRWRYSRVPELAVEGIDKSCARAAVTREPEAEESPLLEAVARERMVKTQQAWKGLTGAAVSCKVWRLAVAL
jgi:hypothetical protein